MARPKGWMRCWLRFLWSEQACSFSLWASHWSPLVCATLGVDEQGRPQPSKDKAPRTLLLVVGMTIPEVSRVAAVARITVEDVGHDVTGYPANARSERDASKRHIIVTCLGKGVVGVNSAVRAVTRPAAPG